MFKSSYCLVGDMKGWQWCGSNSNASSLSDIVLYSCWSGTP